MNALATNSGSPFIRNIVVQFGTPSELTVNGVFKDIGNQIFSDGSPNGLRVRFNITQHIAGIAQPSTIEIYNLSENTRLKFRRFDTKVVLYAGYADMGGGKPQLRLLFNGQLLASFTRREGADLVTVLMVLSGYDAMTAVIGAGGVRSLSGQVTGASLTLLNGGTNPTYTVQNAEGMKVSEIVAAIAQAIPNVYYDSSYIQIPDNVVRKTPFTFVGSAKDALDQLGKEYKFSAYVNSLGVLVAVSDDKWLLTGGVEISAENGTLIRAEPQLNGTLSALTGVSITAVLDPNINPQPGSMVKLVSRVNTQLNNVETNKQIIDYDPNNRYGYKALSINYSGDSHSSQWEARIESTFVGDKR